MSGARPDSPAAMGSRVFHGWWVVLALFLSGFMLFGGGLYSFILMVPVLSAEFHWSRAATGGIVSAFWVAAPIALAGGILVRRFGVRALLVTGVLTESICLAAFAVSSSLPVMLAFRALMGLGKVLVAICTPVAIGRWFSRHFGLGCALAWAGWYLGGLVLAPLTQIVIRAFGWRRACMELALLTILVALPAALWAMRIERPEEIGAGLDGRAVRIRSSGERTNIASSSTTDQYRKFIAAPVFWLIVLGTVCAWIAYAGSLTHQSALIQEAGISGRWTSFALGSSAAFAAVATLAAGWIVDRWSLLVVGVVANGLLASGVLGLLLFHATHAVAPLVLHIICIGTAVGVANVFWTTALKRRLGDADFDYIYGVWYFFMVATLLTAPVAVGFLYDSAGSYTTALILLLVAAFAAGVIGVFVAREGREPRRQSLPADGVT